MYVKMLSQIFFQGHSFRWSNAYSEKVYPAHELSLSLSLRQVGFQEETWIVLFRVKCEIHWKKLFYLATYRAIFPWNLRIMRLIKISKLHHLLPWVFFHPNKKHKFTIEIDFSGKLFKKYSPIKIHQQFFIVLHLPTQQIRLAQHFVIWSTMTWYSKWCPMDILLQ